MEKTKIDLHNHSIYSCDGQFTPRQLIATARSAGLGAMALTDHNTVRGVANAIDEGRAADIEVIPAIELDCTFEGVIFHLLGYGIDPSHSAFQEIEQAIIDQEQKSIAQKIELFHKVGIPLDKDKAIRHAKDGVYFTGEIVAEMVLTDPKYDDNPLLIPYRPGGSRSDNPFVNFFWDFCGQGKPAYVHIEYITMEQALRILKEAGGVPILAHPGNNLENRLEMLPDIVKLGAEGLEVYSSYHTPEQTAYFKQYAHEHGLLETGGSDYHGKTKPSVRMGEFGMDADGAELLDALKNRILMGK